MEIPINIDFSALEFFIRSIYTDEEVTKMGFKTSQNILNGSSIDDNNDNSNNNADAEGNFESQNSGNDENPQKQNLNGNIHNRQNQQMSASFPSPNSPREVLMTVSATTSGIVNNERRCLSQEIYR